MQTAIDDLDQLEEKIREQDPAYAELTYPKGASFAQIQALTDENSQLLCFALGENASYMWLVSLDQLIAFPLPLR